MYHSYAHHTFSQCQWQKIHYCRDCWFIIDVEMLKKSFTMTLSIYLKSAPVQGRVQKEMSFFDDIFLYCLWMMITLLSQNQTVSVKFYNIDHVLISQAQGLSFLLILSSMPVVVITFSMIRSRKISQGIQFRSSRLTRIIKNTFPP